MGDRGTREAWVTLATNDAYALGALVLGNSLRRVATTRRIVVMLTEGVSQEMRGQLQAVYDELVTVGTVDSEDERNLALLGRPDLNLTFTKIHCWELTQYQKCVFLDADTLVLQNSDELFDREELSAAPDAGWPDCFNSGVFVFQPSLETYQRIMAYAQSIGSFDGGDQGLLNSYFNTWSTQDIQKHLPFIYNVVSQAFYSYLPAFTHFRGKIKIVHFIGAIKPWHHPYNTATKTVTTFPETGHCQEFLQLWWDLFMELVQPRLDPTLGGLVGELAQMKIGAGEAAADYIILDDRERRLAWERGHADYLGADSFDNIKRKLDEKLVPLPPSKDPKDVTKQRQIGQGEVSADKSTEFKQRKSSVTRRRSSEATEKKAAQKALSRQRSKSLGEAATLKEGKEALGEGKEKTDSKTN
ncbi:glycogenin-1-like isoform X4 [Littorina saxatilis]|uniref:glycogenin-1-like isoform X4 n=1 Tax=Littorina saxatilis TaxID=31220 RepID=UPI0038B5DB92